jgi:hypothetical protein
MASDFSVAWQCLSKNTIGFSLKIDFHTLIRLVVSPSSFLTPVHGMEYTPRAHALCLHLWNLRVLKSLFQWDPTFAGYVNCRGLAG